MRQYLEEAKQELKRVDHLVYVSLKYTRTVDVIKSVLERLIAAYDFIVMELLEYIKEQKKIDKFPQTPLERVELIQNTFQDHIELNEALNFYLKLRKLSRAPYGKREEFRRHVTMIAKLDNWETEEISIDVVKEYFDNTKKFVDQIYVMIEGEKE